MRKYGILIACISLLLLPAAAEGAAAAGGETGNLVVPSADLLQQGQVTASWRQEAKGHTLSLSAAPAERLEVTVQRSVQPGEATLQGGMKYALRPETIFQPGIAVGVEDAAAAAKRSFYGVVSKTLPYGVRVHAGLGNGRFKGPFGALEVRPFLKSRPGVFPDTALYAEYTGRHAVYGLRLSLVRGAKLEFGVDGHEHFIGVSYQYGL